MKHGMSRTKTYRSWSGAKSRCFNASNPAFEHYGGRGITMCDRWKDSFANFLEDMGECPPYAYWGLDRINNDGNYEPGNCRWADAHTQANNRSTTVTDKRVWFNIGMRKSDKKRLEVAATARGMSISALVEAVCLSALDGGPK